MITIRKTFVRGAAARLRTRAVAGRECLAASETPTPMALALALLAGGAAYVLPTVSRADALRLAAASALALPLHAGATSGAVGSRAGIDGAISEFEVVPGQRTRPGKLDINNSPVSDYMSYPGMYPTIGGKIANGGPYASVNDMFKALSESERATAKKYAKSFVATPANAALDPMRGRDPYRKLKVLE